MDALTNHYGSSSEDEAEDDSKDQPDTKKAKVTIEDAQMFAFAAPHFGKDTAAAAATTLGTL